MSKTLVAVFDTYNSAENAAKEIKDNGLRTDDISIVVKHSDQNTQTDVTGMGANGMGTTGPGTGATMTGTSNTMTGTNNTSNFGTTAKNDNISDGIVTGGILGGLAGLLIGAGSMMIPGLGVIAAAGPITGLISGAVTGGVVGGLIDLGIPENRSKQYETQLKEGRILFSMRTDDDKIGQVTSILKNNGAVSVDTY